MKIMIPIIHTFVEYKINIWMNFVLILKYSMEVSSFYRRRKVNCVETMLQDNLTYVKSN